MKEFTLNVMVEAISFFGDLKMLDKRINPNNYQNGIADEEFVKFIPMVAWLLIKDRDSFPSLCKFKSLFILEKYDIYYNNITIIIDVINRSNPLSVKKHSKDLKSYEQYVNKRKQKIPVNYPEVFTYLATNISISLNEFYELTIRQIDAIKKEVEKIERKKLEQLAMLHGVKLKHSSSFSPIEFSEDENDFLEKMAQNDFNKFKNQGGILNG